MNVTTKSLDKSPRYLTASEIPVGQFFRHIHSRHDDYYIKLADDEYVWFGFTVYGNKIKFFKELVSGREFYLSPASVTIEA